MAGVDGKSGASGKRRLIPPPDHCEFAVVGARHEFTSSRSCCERTGSGGGRRSDANGARGSTAVPPSPRRKERSSSAVDIDRTPKRDTESVG